MSSKKLVTIVCVMLLCIVIPLMAAGSREDAREAARDMEQAKNYVASTSWTAAFAELAGLDDVVTIAPASLRHPPEYEIKASDIANLMTADLFVYAGYERMMSTIQESVRLPQEKQVKITTANNIDNVRVQTAAIAGLAGTQEANANRVEAYAAVIEAGRAEVVRRGMDKVPAMVHAMQVPLAKDLGLDVRATFGSAPATAAQIADAATGVYGIIIDNVHNPVAGPLAEVSPSSKLVVWRNFPETVGGDALQTMVEANIEALLR
ncbi:MAG: ABC transporter substrate-binding protein [Sphaerochaetaceae bacterium]|nr:ABC transporter substrate-binding protein [Sphaerochaetaceae bacterium]